MMIKKFALLALAICLLLTLLGSSLVQAQGQLEILDSSAVADFPTKLNFSLSVRSNVDIVDIRLCYTIDRIQFSEVTSEIYIEFEPAPAVEVQWPLEMIKFGGLPPGSSLAYWWLVKDAAGHQVQTSRTQVQFSDERYSWHSLTEGEITIYWYKGEESFARELMTAAQTALERLAADTGARLEKPVQLYIYASTQDLIGSMIYPQEWTGGVAFTRFGTIAIGINSSNLDWGKGAIAHELAHLVIHQMTLNPYGELPVWLDEGLAMYAEGLPGPQFTSRLHQAVVEDKLISVRSLASPFSAYSDTAVLSYAESYSLVEFLIYEYGQPKMLELLNTFRQGSDYDDALQKVYGFDMDGLNTLWRDYVIRQYRPAEEMGNQPISTRISLAPAVSY
jgi:hypothetical protein